MSRKECQEYCGRQRMKGSTHCCGRCARSQGYGDHSTSCDEREEKREAKE